MNYASSPHANSHKCCLMRDLEPFFFALFCTPCTLFNVQIQAGFHPASAETREYPATGSAGGNLNVFNVYTLSLRFIVFLAFWNAPFVRPAEAHPSTCVRQSTLNPRVGGRARGTHSQGASRSQVREGPVHAEEQNNSARCIVIIINSRNLISKEN